MARFIAGDGDGTSGVIPHLQEHRFHLRKPKFFVPRSLDTSLGHFCYCHKWSFVRRFMTKLPIELSPAKSATEDAKVLISNVP